MTSPLVEDHLPALAEALADAATRRGGPCAVTTPELAGLTGVPGGYIRVIGDKHVAALNAALRRLGLRVTFEGWAFKTQPLSQLAPRPHLEGMRTDISEDAKGDPTKQIGGPDPTKGRPPGVDPLLPPKDVDAAPSAQDDDDDEDTGRYATLSDRVEGGPEHAPDDDKTPRPDRAPERPKQG